MTREHEFDYLDLELSWDRQDKVRTKLAQWWAQRRNQTMNRGGWIWSTTHTRLVQGWLNYYNLEYGMIMAELSHLVGISTNQVTNLDKPLTRWYLDGFPLGLMLQGGHSEPSETILILKALRSHFTRDIGPAAARKIWDARVIQSRLEGLAT
jgi:hypothetical protein